MKLFNWEIKKIKKEKIVVFEQHPTITKLRLDGDGWSPFEALGAGNEITDIFNELPKSLTLEEKVQIFKLFLPELTFKIIK